MNQIDLQSVIEFIERGIGPQFHDKKLAKIKKLMLDDIIKRKNPYLFKAKGNNNAADLISGVLTATVSSGEETIFGNFLEQISIFVCEKTFGGRKSTTRGIDLEYEHGKAKYLVSIKSGPNWGNSDQIKSMVKNFTSARKTHATSGGNSKDQILICVEACCYGKDEQPEKGTHIKLCGQRYWELISNGNTRLYRDIIEPLGIEASNRNIELNQLIEQKMNLFTADFVRRFCKRGIIDWDKLIQFNSGKGERN